MSDAHSKIKRASRIGLGDPTSKDLQALKTRGDQIIQKPMRKGTSSATRDAKNMALLQQQKDNASIAQSEDEIARRKALAGGKGGRRSLMSSTPTGLATTLGGQ